MVWYDPLSVVMGKVQAEYTEWGNAFSCIITKIESLSAQVIPASALVAGLCPKLSGIATQFLRGDGVFAAVTITDTFTIRIPASEIAQNIMTPLSMGGDGAEALKERLSNGFERWYLGFGYTDDQYACIAVPLPDDFNAGSLTITALWETPSAALGTCIIEVYGELITDNDLSAVSFTSSIATISDTNNGADRLNISAATALSPSGSGNYLPLRITRDYGTDTLEDDMKLLELVIEGTRTVTS